MTEGEKLTVPPGPRKSLLGSLAPDPKGRRRRKSAAMPRPAPASGAAGPLGRGWEPIETPKL